jgi:hypothetical protein
VTFRGHEAALPGSGWEYRDYALGADLDDTWTPDAVGLDLGAIDWSDRLRVAAVSGAKLDEIEAAITRGVKEYQVAVEVAALENYDDDEDDDDGDT